MIAGFERPSQVRAVLAAFEHERKGASSQAHRDAIAEQEAIFRAELDRMEAEGVKDPVKHAPEPWVGRAWTGGRWGEGFSSTARVTGR